VAAVSDRIRVAVAGLGGVAQSVHLPLLTRRWDLFEIAAVCDLSPSLRDEIGDQYGVARADRFADVDEMVSTTEADGVLLLTSGSHGASALHALRRGVSVFCEKPLAYTIAEAGRLAEAQAAVGRPALLLAYMKEYDDAVARLREHLAGVEDVRAVDVQVLHPSTASQLAFANLRPPPGDVTREAIRLVRAAEDEVLDAALGTEAAGWLRPLYANVVLGSIVHDTSLLRVLFGGLDRVDDVRIWPDRTYPPSVDVSGPLGNGARARIAWHYLPGYPAYRETVAVHHGRGSLQLTFGTPYLLNAPSELTVVEAALGGEVRSTYRSKGEAFENELVDFHRMVTSATRPRAGVAQGRDDIVTSQRIMRRLAEQQRIAVGGEAATA